MRVVFFVLILVVLTPVTVFAQGNLSVGGFAAFYNPRLDAVNNLYEEAVREGLRVDELEGNLSFGGFAGYELTDNWGLRLHGTYWSESASLKDTTNVADPRLRDPVTQKQEIRIVRFMFDGKYYLNPAESWIRFYVGTGFGLIFIEDKLRSELDIPNFDGTTTRQTFMREQTFWEFGLRPFLGAQLFSQGRLSVFAETGYMIGKYPIISSTIEDNSGVISIITEIEEASLNGLSAMLGVKLNL